MNTQSNNEAIIREYYRAAKQSISGPVTLLHIDTDHTAAACGENSEPSILILDLGTEITAARFFRHTPPSALELEEAIITVEDEVTRVQKVMPHGSALISTDPILREIAMLSGVKESADMILAIEAMEQTFKRFEAVIFGRPAGFEKLPEGNAFAAALLILREFMHHLRFTEIHCKAEVTP